jgi:hypothetical protein
MAFIHGKNTVVMLNSVDLSTFTNNTQSSSTADSHDVTCYGATAHVYFGGLLDGKFTISGTYDDGASGPRATIIALIGTVVNFKVRPKGTGSGLAQTSLNVLVTSYQETAPVADMVTWQAELQAAGAPSYTVQ